MNASVLFLPSSIPQIPLLIVAGALLGWAYFRALRWNTRLFLKNDGLWRALVLLVARTSLTALVLYVCARHGLSLPLILLGFVMARYVVMRKEKIT